MYPMSLKSTGRSIVLKTGVSATECTVTVIKLERLLKEKPKKTKQKQCVSQTTTKHKKCVCSYLISKQVKAIYGLKSSFSEAY